jgi:putative transposase
MKKSKFSDSQVIEALKRGEGGLSVPELFRELGISSATFSKWRAKYGGMDTSMLARMNELEAENARLKAGILKGARPKTLLTARGSASGWRAISSRSARPATV